MKVVVRRAQPVFTLLGPIRYWHVYTGGVIPAASFERWDHAIWYANAYARAVQSRREAS